jgi:ubiquinone biosynthesis protein
MIKTLIVAARDRNRLTEILQIASTFGLSTLFSAAIRRATVRIVRARLSPERWAPTVQTLAWELAKIGDDGPRLVRAAMRRLEADPPVTNGDSRAAIISAGRWIAGAILIGLAMVAAALAFS